MAASKDIKEISKFNEQKKNLPVFIQEFLDHKVYTEGKKISTMLGYIFEINMFLDHLKISTLDDFSQINKQSISKYIQNRTQSTNSKATVARTTAAIKSLFRYLYQFDLIEANPTEAIKVPLPKPKSINVIKPLSEDEIQYLLLSIKEGLKNSDESVIYKEMLLTGKSKGKGLTDRQKAWNKHIAFRDYTICLLLFTTGLRVSEVEALNISDYTPSTFIKDKLILGNLQVIRKGKSKEETQPVYLNDEVEQTLNEYINKHRKSPEKDQSALFVDMFQKGRFKKRGMQEMVKKYALTFLGRTDFSIHKCRHTAAQNLYNTSSDIYLVSKFLSHSDVKTSQRYAQHTDKQLMEAANRMKFMKEERE